MKGKKNILRTDQLQKRILEGLYGEEAKLSHLEIQKFDSNPIEGYIAYINDFYNKDIASQFRDYPLSLVKVIVYSYLKNHQKNEDIPILFSKILFEDVLDTPGSSVSNKYQGMMDSYHAYKQGLSTGNRLILWELSKSTFLSYNEFLNGILGLVIINLRVASGLNYKPGILKNKYGVNRNQYLEIIPNDEFFSVFGELLQSELRNAIGHQTIWFDETNLVVRYQANPDGEEQELPLDEFVFLTSKASYLAEAYIVGLCAIGVIKSPNIMDKTRLPKELFSFLMDHAPTIKRIG